MGVEMSAEEIDRFLLEGHTVTFITINKEGAPLPAPLWYVNKGPVIYVGTMRTTRKAKNLQRDPRVVAQVEDGQHYLKLRSVIVKGTAEIVDDPDELAWVSERMAEKYGAFRPTMSAMPAATHKHYDNPRMTIKVVPSKIKTWDNSKLRTGRPAPDAEETTARSG